MARSETGRIGAVEKPFKKGENYGVYYNERTP
jgi:hypothetical protein